MQIVCFFWQTINAAVNSFLLYHDGLLQRHVKHVGCVLVNLVHVFLCILTQLIIIIIIIIIFIMYVAIIQLLCVDRRAARLLRLDGVWQTTTSWWV